MIHWLRTAVDTYVLHSEHGNGYQWYSGPAVVGGLFTNAYVLARKHNCYEHHCWRVGRVRGDDGHIRCKKHDKHQHPERYQAIARWWRRG